jgi:hypothetical protein
MPKVSRTRSRSAGSARSPRRTSPAAVDAGDPVDDVAVAGDELAGLDHDDIALRQQRCRHLLGGCGRRVVALRPAADTPGDRVGLGPAKRLSLRLAAALGDRLGQVGEHDGEPQPDRDQPGEDGRVGDREHRGEDGSDLHDEHDRVTPQGARVELAQRAGKRPP